MDKIKLSELSWRDLPNGFASPELVTWLRDHIDTTPEPVADETLDKAIEEGWNKTHYVMPPEVAKSIRDQVKPYTVRQDGPVIPWERAPGGCTKAALVFDSEPEMTWGDEWFIAEYHRPTPPKSAKDRLADKLATMTEDEAADALAKLEE